MGKVSQKIGGIMVNVIETTYPYTPKDFNDIPKNNRGEWLSKFKLKFGCSCCGYKKCAEALHFHHVGNKTKNVSLLKNTVSWKVIKEICQCSILCANCHIELHKEME
jgi:hypothetical protein